MKMSPVTDVGNSQTLYKSQENQLNISSMVLQLPRFPTSPLSLVTVLSSPRQLETITSNQQAPARFHHTKNPCALSAHSLRHWICVCVLKCLHGCTPPPSLFFFPFMCICLTGGEIRTDSSKDGSQAAACGFDLQDWKMTLFCSNSCCFC